MSDKWGVKTSKLWLIGVPCLCVTALIAILHGKPNDRMPVRSRQTVGRMGPADESWVPVTDPAETPPSLAPRSPARRPPHHLPQSEPLTRPSGAFAQR